MRRAKDAGSLLAPVALAIGCCAGLPALAGMFAGLTLAVILGVGGGLIAFIAAGAGIVLVLRARRRRSCTPTSQRSAS
jgi:hypothetical protein